MKKYIFSITWCLFCPSGQGLAQRSYLIFNVILNYCEIMGKVDETYREACVLKPRWKLSSSFQGPEPGEWHCGSRLSRGGRRAGYSLCEGLRRRGWGGRLDKGDSDAGEGGRQITVVDHGLAACLSPVSGVREGTWYQ